MFIWQRRPLCCKAAVAQRASQKWNVLFCEKCKKHFKKLILLRFVVPFRWEAQGEVDLIHFFPSLSFSLLF